MTRLASDACTRRLITTRFDTFGCRISRAAVLQDPGQAGEDHQLYTRTSSSSWISATVVRSRSRRPGHQAGQSPDLRAAQLPAPPGPSPTGASLTAASPGPRPPTRIPLSSPGAPAALRRSSTRLARVSAERLGASSERAIGVSRRRASATSRAPDPAEDGAGRAPALPVAPGLSDLDRWRIPTASTNQMEPGTARRQARGRRRRSRHRSSRRRAGAPVSRLHDRQAACSGGRRHPRGQAADRVATRGRRAPGRSALGPRLHPCSKPLARGFNVGVPPAARTAPEGSSRVGPSCPTRSLRR
jgi:hypothetical protein